MGNYYPANAAPSGFIITHNMKRQKLKAIGHLLLAIVALCLLLRVSRMEYTFEVIESIPESILQEIKAQHPDWNLDKVADYYMKNKSNY